MAASPKPAAPLPSATLVLMRDRVPAGDPEVLMVERSGDSVYGGAYVFPGGLIDLEDVSPQAELLSPGLTPGQAAAALPGVESPALALGAHVAAIRETFEEAGILLAEDEAGRPWLPSPNDAAGLTHVRTAISGGGLRFLEWIAARGLRLATPRLLYFAHWVTPEALPKRFDTRFFLAAAPADAAALHDTREVVSHAWFTPSEALHGVALGRMRMIEPTLKTLERLAGQKSMSTLLRSLRGQPVPRIMPKMIVDGSGRRTLVFPWDSSYDTV